MLSRFQYLNFWTRLTHWEYWPFEVVYFPVLLYWVWLSLRSRSFFFFSAANPAIETGGMMGESKYRILQKIDKQYRPKMLLVRPPSGSDVVIQQMHDSNISFPIIAKPDVGERGWKVEKIQNASQLRAYMQETRGGFLIQEYVDHDLELGVFYYRFPDQPGGIISSVVVKEFLTITGDGRSTFGALLLRDSRARLQYTVLKQRYAHRLGEVLAAGESSVIMPIGNHSRGTKFLNGDYMITPQLIKVFDRISRPIDGFYYGRFDIRCKSLADLYAGSGIRILELNGVGAEPAHIYDPGFPVMKAYRVLFQHWSVLYKISRANYRKGVAYMSLREAIERYIALKRYRKQMVVV